jgi:hypothetical protein
MPSGFRVVRSTSVAPQQLYDRLANVPAWSQWAPMVSRSELIQEGTVDRLGAGAIRRMHSLRGLLTVDEEILEATSPSYQRYTLRGLPATDYVGEVRLDETSGRTQIVWTARFRPRVPGTGWALGKFLGFSIARITDSMIAACERSATHDD